MFSFSRRNSALFLLLCLSACSKDKSEKGWASPSSTAPVRQTDAQACQAFIASLPSDVVREYIDVPEDPSNPNSPTLHIFFYGKILIGKQPALFVNGGPGSDSHAEYRLMTNAGQVDSAWANASLIFFDQRGNGCSSGYPQGNSDETLARLRFYGSSGIVADAEAIRKHLLGDKPWRVIGQSYGGWVVHRYAIQAPSGMTNAYSQANVISDDPVERVTNRISSQNRVLENYFKFYPQDRAALQTLHGALSNTKCYPSSKAASRRCGLAVISPLTQRFPFVPRWSWVHDWLAAMVKNGALNDRAINDFLNKNVFALADDPSNLKLWPSFVIDAFDRDVPPFNRPTCEAIYAKLHARGEAPESYLLHECMAAMQFPVRQAELDDINARLSRLGAKYGNEHLSISMLKASLATHPDLHFFLYSGQLDTMMPMENFPPEVSALGNLVTYRHFLSSGHDGYYTEHQIAQDVLE